MEDERWGKICSSDKHKVQLEAVSLRGQYCLMSSGMAEVYSQQVSGKQQMDGRGEQQQQAGWQGCYSEGPEQTGEMG